MLNVAAVHKGFVQRTACPVCGDAHPAEYFSTPFAEGEVRDFLFAYYMLHELYSQAEWKAKVAGQNYALFECRSCRALFQASAPNDEFVAEIYARWIGHNRPGGQSRYPLGEYSHWMGEAMTLTHHMLNLTGKTSPEDLRVLDYGIGHGVFARAMEACGCQVWGFDSRRTYRQRQRRVASELLHWRIAGRSSISSTPSKSLSTFENRARPAGCSAVRL